MSPGTVIGLVVGVMAALGGVVAVLGWRSGAKAMPLPSPSLATARTADRTREADRVASARRDQVARAQELRNASVTPDMDERSDALATIGNGRSVRARR
jgi:hypothetical protein